MITKFETSGNAGGSATAKGGSNTLLYILAGAVILYLGYKYVIKPAMEEKKKAEEANENK